LPVCHLSTEFSENQFGSFCIILLPNKITNAGESITSLVEVITDIHKSAFLYIYEVY